MNNQNNNIAFLFGAGISIPTGIHPTSEITKRILCGNNILNVSSSKPPTFTRKN